MQKIDLGNNESLVCGVFPNQDGTFTAMTYTKSKTFKTETGVRRVPQPGWNVHCHDVYQKQNI
ncbi:DUF1391 domain-containing protein [Escherichia coli]|nr:DUF1391 domain-containing protein [Escherichia coli]